MGLDDLESLKKAVRDQLGRDYGRVVRSRLKRQLLDNLAEFAQFRGAAGHGRPGVRRDLEERRGRAQAGPLSDPALAGKSEDELKAEFRRIAERRVRLGLLLSEVGRPTISRSARRK